MLDMVCHTSLRVPVQRQEDEYRFLVVLALQGLFQFGLNTGLVVTIMAYIGFTVVEANFATTGLLENGRIAHLVVWACVQLLSTIVVQVLINAIG